MSAGKGILPTPTTKYPDVMSQWKKISIIGAGNLGQAIAEGITASGLYEPSSITLSRRRAEQLEPFRERGFKTVSDNLEAVAASDILLIAVEPHQLDSLLAEIREKIDPDRHLLISVIAGVETETILEKIGRAVPLVRSAPNTAVSVGKSMTCLCSADGNRDALQAAERIFATIGETAVLDESMMPAATALCASGIAFFLRAVRAASQAGVEIGFSPELARKLAAQTAYGATALLLHRGTDPESEIDRVTTPGGCTISGLNRMEKKGFSSAMIEGIRHATDKAKRLHDN